MYKAILAISIAVLTAADETMDDDEEVLSLGTLFS